MYACMAQQELMEEATNQRKKTKAVRIKKRQEGKEEDKMSGNGKQIIDSHL